MTQNTAPLAGIKIVDFTAVQSGPSCTQLLAWLGADVIKIERPGSGDATRNELQFDPDCPSYYFLQLNSNKKSLSLDAATPDGKEILTKLIKECDIFIENLHPGAMDKLGFGWDVVHKLNPRCIYGTIKGFPVASSYKDLKAYEPVAQVTTYMEMIFWSISEISFCRFFTTCGSNVVFLSCGTAISTLP